MNRPVFVVCTLATSLINLLPPFSNWAYIDPNVGGQLFQILAAGFAVFSGVALLFARQIRAGFARLKRAIRNVASEDDMDQEETPARQTDSQEKGQI